MAEPISVASERRRLERRTNPTLAELTLPELRRMMVTTILFVVIVVLFLWMVRVGHHRGDPRRSSSRRSCGRCTCGCSRGSRARSSRRRSRWRCSSCPLLALTRVQLRGDRRRRDVRRTRTRTRSRRGSTRRCTSCRSCKRRTRGAAVKHYVVVASNYGTKILGALRVGAGEPSRSRATIFVFTVFYVLGDADDDHGVLCGAESRRATASCRRRWRRTCAACCTARSIRRS